MKNSKSNVTVGLVIGLLILLIVCTAGYVVTINLSKDIFINSQNSVLASESLQQSDEKYLIYYYDSTTITETQKAEISNFKENFGSFVPVYLVDINNPENAEFVGETNLPVGENPDIASFKLAAADAPTLMLVTVEKDVEAKTSLVTVREVTTSQAAIDELINTLSNDVVNENTKTAG